MRWPPEVELRPAAAGDDGRAVRLETADGRVLWDARALAELSPGAWAHAVRSWDGAAMLADALWQIGLWLGPVLAIVGRAFHGDSLVRPSLVRTRSLALRVIGLATVAAAVSWWVQVDGLVGSGGIAPAAEWLEQVKSYAARHDASAFTLAPTWLWLGASDAALHLTCGLATLGGALLALGVVPGLGAALALLAYLSLVATGDVFMGYQWDGLMLEGLTVALLLAPWSRLTLGRAKDLEPSRVAVMLCRVVAFKLYFMSGVVKLASHDPVWADLTALDFHLWTQPLPSPSSFWLLDAPGWVLSALCAFTLATELVLPWALLLPSALRRVRVMATWLMLGLQVGIAATGNFGYFNLLSFGILAMGLDDRAFEGWRRTQAWRPPVPLTAEARRPWWERWRAWLALPRTALALVLVLVNLYEVRATWLEAEPPPLVAGVESALAPFRIANTYGLFANMTTERPEIELQGSDDGLHWRTYDFAWKPDGEDDAPGFAGPHMPRLDWQLWFAALSGDCFGRRVAWYQHFLERVLQGAPEVLALIGRNPFPDAPPQYLRSLLWEYAPAAPGKPGWWQRSEPRTFCPDVTWRNGRLQKVHFGPPEPDG
ncbi:MAG: lipase maturation factor family protein [Myxococcota bacterium]